MIRSLIGQLKTGRMEELNGQKLLSVLFRSKQETARGKLK